MWCLPDSSGGAFAAQSGQWSNLILKSTSYVRRKMPPPLGWIQSLLLFGSAGAVLFIVSRGVMVAIRAATRLEPVLAWFLAGGLGLFAPLVLTGMFMLRREGALARGGNLPERLRCRAMTRSDWRWSLVALAVVGLAGAIMVGLLRLTAGGVTMQPSFMHLEPLGPGRYWILLAWIPFWLLNILGEEFVWRGVVLPRQERAFGEWAWLVNGAGWMLFHLAFGPAVLAVLWPTTFILPYVVQRTQNIWSGVIIHAGLNGPAFIAVAFGVV
jgi:membrane protease YdiL (CAAX protease family)